MKDFNVLEPDNFDELPDQPEYEICDKLISCAESVLSYVAENIKTEFYSGASFVVPIPLNLHALLSEKYNANYSDYSRDLTFEVIRHIFNSLANDQNYKQEITDKINSVMVVPSVVSSVSDWKTKCQEKENTEDIPSDRRIFNHVDSNSTENDVPSLKVTWIEMFDNPSVDVQVINKSTGDTKKHQEGGDIIVEIWFSNE